MTSIYQSEALKLDARSKEILKEMGDDPAKRLAQIELLRKWIVTHDFVECRTDDKFLLRFLRVSKFSCEAAKERIQKFCLLRTSKLDGLPEWFVNQSVNDPIIREYVSSGMMYMMPKPDDLGRLVVVFDMEVMGKMKIDPEQMMRACYAMFDWIVHTFERAQINGVTIVEIGSNNFDMELMKYWTNMDRMKKSMELWQGAVPLRTKGLEYYNMPQVMKTLIETFMKMMKPKMAKRIRFHSDQKPAENIPSDCMPSNLGGTGAKFEDLKDDLLREMESFQAEFDSLKMCKVIESKVPKKYVQGDDWGIGGSYIPIATD